MKMQIVVLVGVAFFVGCGAGSDLFAPTVHQIDSGAKRVPKGQPVSLAAFSLPEGATVTYNIVDMPTGVGSDTMHFQVEGAGTAYAVRTSVSSTGATTPPLPAGAYDFVVSCDNFIDDCLFSDTVTASY